MGVALKKWVETRKEEIEFFLSIQCITTSLNEKYLARTGLKLIAEIEFLADEWKRELNINCELLEERKQLQVVREATEKFVKAYYDDQPEQALKFLIAELNKALAGKDN